MLLGTRTTQPPATEDIADSTYVVFTVDQEQYALSVAQVQRTLPLAPLTRVPADDPAIAGVFQHAGRIITVWDARRWFEAGNDPPNEPWLVIVDHAGRARAVLVDRVADVLGVPGGAIKAVRRLPRGVPKDAIRGRLTAPRVLQDDDGDDTGDDAPATLDKEQAERRVQRLAAETLKRLGPVYVINLDALLPGVTT